MKITFAEKMLVIMAFIQGFLVFFHGTYESSYPKIYEDILGMIAMFLLIIFSFMRELAIFLKGKK